MFDYRGWFERAEAFVRGLATLPGQIEIKGSVAPPLSHAEVDELAQASRLPIPESLRAMWTTGSAHCELSYVWTEIPTTLQKHVSTFSDDAHDRSYVMGGAQFESAAEIVELTHQWPFWAEGMRPDYPKDARIYDHTLSLIPLGDGDRLGLYVRDEVKDPPVVYMCHDGCGASRVIAPTLGAFLGIWEELCYINPHSLTHFIHPDTQLLDLPRHAHVLPVIKDLFRGIPHADVSQLDHYRTEAEWQVAYNPWLMLLQLERAGRVNSRKNRLYCYALCQSVRDELQDFQLRALETAFRYAYGRATSAELEAARLELLRLTDWSTFRPPIIEAINGSWIGTCSMTDRFDDPELVAVKSAHADLIRHIYGNPFRALPLEPVTDERVRQLAGELAAGKSVAAELSAVLAELDHAELADHFQTPDHPPGCWALDWLLGLDESSRGLQA